MNNILTKLGKIIPTADMDGVYDNYREDRRRDAKYSLPDEMGQFWTVYRMQMKLFTKGAVPLMIIALIIAIPVLIYSGALDSAVIDSVRAEIGDTGETYMAICLSLISVMMILLASIVCGSMLSQEFRMRTAFLNFAMPQSRSSFYMGKFLAGFTLVLVAVLLAFSVSIIMATAAGYPSVSSYAVGQALLLSVTGTLSFCCIAYGLSAFMAKGSTMMPFVLLFVLLPAFTIVLAGGFAGYVPSFAGNMALNALGYANSPSVAMLFPNTSADMSASVFGASAVYTVCGIAMLLLGLFKTKGREI